MPNYRIYRLREAARPHFRAAPQVTGTASVKRKDYEETGTIEAPNEYAAWRQSRESGPAIEVGDLLENEAGELRICKYVGFDAAQWFVPPEPAAAAPGDAPPADAAPAPPAEELRYTSADPAAGK